MADLTRATIPYALAYCGLKEINDKDWQRKCQEKFEECSERLRIALCKDLNMPSSTKWKFFLELAGQLNDPEIPKEERDRRLSGALNIKISSPTVRICDELKNLRFLITGEV